MRTVIFLLVIIVCTVSVFSQKTLDKLSPRLLVPKAECSLNSSFLQSVESTTEPDDLILIISHLGKSEKDKVADRRLYNARTFISRFATKARSPERIIISKGEKSTADGYLDFFVNGQLEMRVIFPKNRDLLVQPCVQDPEKTPCSDEDSLFYYPCRAKN